MLTTKQCQQISLRIRSKFIKLGQHTLHTQFLVAPRLPILLKFRGQYFIKLKTFKNFKRVCVYLFIDLNNFLYNTEIGIEQIINILINICSIPTKT